MSNQDKEHEQSHTNSEENENNESQSASTSATSGWTREEKYILLQALKYSDSSEIDRIHLMLPAKTPDEIRRIIAYYKNRALDHPMFKDRLKKEKKSINNVSQVPLAQWAKLLTDTFTYKELETETATALRLIAEFDKIPCQVNTGGVDFREIYHALANAMEGKCLPDDKMVNAILEKCIIETAYASKSFIRNTSFKNVIHSINMADKEISVFPRPTDNHELANLRHLSSQRRYNPLNISETYLKPSLHN